MGKIYNASGSPIPVQKASGATPIDERDSVAKVADLFDSTFWTGYAYHGMRVSVINDGEKNGVYMLRRGTKFQYQNFDPTEEHYSPSELGWIKLADTTQIDNHYVADETLFITKN